MKRRIDKDGNEEDYKNDDFEDDDVDEDNVGNDAGDCDYDDPATTAI